MRIFEETTVAMLAKEHHNSEPQRVRVDVYSTEAPHCGALQVVAHKTGKPLSRFYYYDPKDAPTNGYSKEDAHWALQQCRWQPCST